MRGPGRLTLLLLLLCIVSSFLRTSVVRGEPADDPDAEQVDEDDDDDDAEDVDEQDVLVLTQKNFEKTIKDTEYVLAEFYAPWCGFCKQLAPEFAAAATALSDVHNVALAKIDATVETDLAEAHGIDGYPTLKWFVNGTAHEYSGGRDEQGILRWIKKQLGPPATPIDTAAALAAHEAEHGALLLGYFAALDDSDAAFVKYKEAVLECDTPALVSASADVAAAAGGVAPGSVVLIKNQKGSEREVVPYKGELAGEPLRRFAFAQALPLVTPFSAATSELIFSSDISRHLLFVAPKATLAAAGGPLAEFRAAAAELRAAQDFVFVSVESDDEEGEPVVEFFGLSPADLPTLIGFQVEPDQKKYKYDGALKSADIVAFAKGILDGRVQPTFNSQDVPENDMDGDVKVVVGKTFESIALDPTKDVLLEVYAPWCGHCQALEPAYKKVAARFKGVDSVVVAKMDGTENEHPSLEVEGFPSILFFPAAKGAEAIEYDGDRKVEDFVEFIQKQAKSKFELPKEPAAAPDTDPVDAKKDAEAAASRPDEL